MCLQLLQLKKAGRAPAIEVCPTSNLVTLGLKSYADHPHIRRLLALNYPLSLHTDDSGIFNTTLSKEFKHIVGALGMKMVDALQLSCER
jgi:adenosine deaminase